MPTIFVSIASYRDPELIPTLKNMIENAAAPENLHIAVCWQQQEQKNVFESAGMSLKEKTSLDTFEKLIYGYLKARISIIKVNYFQSEGACWARSLAEKCFENERYFLQIDSHCRFIRHWDNEMIEIHTALQAKSVKPVLSYYPPGYEAGEHENRGKQVSRVSFREFNSAGIPLFSPSIFNSNGPVRNSYLAGGFIFAEGCFVKEVPNDPAIFFEGEEITMSARAFTHGYDIYIPDKILLWHFYSRNHCKKVWSDHNQEAKDRGEIDITWWERDLKSRKRIRHIFGIEKDESCDADAFMPGAARSLRDFEYSAGIDFLAQAVQPEVLTKERVSFFPYPPANPAEWQKRLIAPHRRNITLKLSDISTVWEQLASCCITIVDINNALLEAVTLSKTELQEKTDRENNNRLTIPLSFNTPVIIKPAKIRITPFYHEQGWGETRELSW